MTNSGRRDAASLFIPPRSRLATRRRAGGAPGTALESGPGAFALVLRHPLTVLVLTALLTGVLAPRITGMWQDSAKQLETKLRLVEEIALATETYFSRLQLIELKGAAAAVSLDDALGDWRATYAVLDAKLEAYFPKNPSIQRQWSEIGAALWTTYFLLRNETPEARLAIFSQNERYFGKDVQRFQTLIDTPIERVGDKGAYDRELQPLLDRFRFQRRDLLRDLPRSPLSLR